MKNFFTIVLLMGFLIFPLDLRAVDLSDIQVNGFVSQGYLKSTGNNFLAFDSQNGTYQINEIGVTFNMPLTTKLRVGTQLLSRDLGPDGNNEVIVDWAFGDYRINDALGIRAGKLKFPVGLYNEIRDSDFLRPTALLPQSVYDEMQRGFMTAAYGGALYGNISAGDAGDFDYQLFYGHSQIDDDNFMATAGIKDWGMNTLVPAISSGLTKVDEVHYQPDEAYAATLVYNTPLDGLRLGASYAVSKGKFTSTLDDTLAIVAPAEFAAINALNFDVEASYSPLIVLSAEYSQALFSLSAEYMERDNEIGPAGLASIPGVGEYASFLPETSMGWYVMGTLQVPQIPGLSVSTLYDVYYTDKDNRSEKEVNYYRKDLGFGTRYDFSPNWLAKVEWHTVDGAGNFLELVNDEPLERHWTYVIVKTSYNF